MHRIRRAGLPGGQGAGPARSLFVRVSRIGPVAAVVSVLVIAVVYALTSSGRGAAPPLVVHQDSPLLRPAATNAQSAAAGDVQVFDAPFASRDGLFTGVVSGSLLAVADPESAGTIQHRLTDLVFQFDGMGAIVVAGGVDYPDDPAGIAADAPLVRKIVEVTGSFSGARGTVTSTLSADGSYRHEFMLET